MDKRTIGIVGMGPRGSYALEQYIAELRNVNALSNVRLLLFEETGRFGNGQVYDVDQVETNWINISERVLELEARGAIALAEQHIPPFPSYHDWCGMDPNSMSIDEPDSYPPRAKIGQYLKERAASILEPLQAAGLATLSNDRIDDVLQEDAALTLVTDKDGKYRVDEILLTIGHQPTGSDKQINAWNKHASGRPNVHLFAAPYPIERFLNADTITPSSTIGLRGFGLAMIDVVRGIASKYGEFVEHPDGSGKLQFFSEHDLSNLLVPFSLDGLPPAPKPLSSRVDELFLPTQNELDELGSIIGDEHRQREATGADLLINAITPIATRVFTELDSAYGGEDLDQVEISKAIIAWLRDENIEHSTMVPKGLSATAMMNEFCNMARANGAIALDYCTGQVWRHCQPTIYSQLSFNACSDAVIAKVIALDERMKRYAYGPPVESVEQLLALANANVLNLNVVNDPAISCVEQGWLLEHEDYAITVGVMIDTVLDPPNINAVNSPLVKSLRSKELVKAVHDELGIHTDKHSYITNTDGQHEEKIALLGRLAKGTVIGVDAILECFGDRPTNWAKKAASRHRAWLSERS